MTKKSYVSDRQIDAAGSLPAFDQPIHVGRPNIGDREDFLQRVEKILDRRWLSNNGPVLQEFEAEISRYLGVRHCIAMCNGTIALEIAIRAPGRFADQFSTYRITAGRSDRSQFGHEPEPTQCRRFARHC